MYSGIIAHEKGKAKQVLTDEGQIAQRSSRRGTRENPNQTGAEPILLYNFGVP